MTVHVVETHRRDERGISTLSWRIKSKTKREKKETKYSKKEPELNRRPAQTLIIFLL